MGSFVKDVGGAVLTAPATLIGAKMQAGAQNKATEAQAKSTAEALAFAKEQEAQKVAAYNQAMQLWQQQWMAQQARRDALLSSYGFSVPSTPSMSMGASAGTSPMTAATMTPPLTGQPQPGVQGVGASPLVGQQSGSLGAILRQPADSGDNAGIGGWNDWKRYGLG